MQNFQASSIGSNLLTILRIFYDVRAVKSVEGVNRKDPILLVFFVFQNWVTCFKFYGHPDFDQI